VSEVEAAELDLHKLKSTQGNALNTSERQLATLKQQLSELDARCARERDAAHEELCGVMDEVTAHKEHVNRLLYALAGQAEAVKLEAQAANF
jgi:hypothetical protein